MWKKALLLLSLFAFTIAVTIPVDSADARPRSFSGGKKSFSNTPSKSQSGVSSSSTTNKSSSTSGTSTNRGLFGGGSFMKGMMIGGLAGMLFGGMFGSGAFGNMMGFLLNAIALFVLFAVIRGIYEAIKRRRQPQQQDPNNNRRW
jgi:predicted lipid-binding transport protein (Tim44 family)